ncbi:MAG TPA: AtpZ/AtpI family protein [Thermoanaerobaculaceae bacterium]|nr:AtpZ/AtpI family protein [Thermoanaerobaculaceae bacterium]
MSNHPSRRGAAFRRIGDAYLIGMILPAAVVIGYFMGKGLDHVTGWTPWGTRVLTVLGVVAGFREAIRIALRVGREEDAAMKGGGPGPGEGK